MNLVTIFRIHFIVSQSCSKALVIMEFSSVLEDEDCRVRVKDILPVCINCDCRESERCIGPSIKRI